MASEVIEGHRRTPFYVMERFWDFLQHWLFDLFLVTGHIVDEHYQDRFWPLVILGLLMFIPGSYHTYFAYKVCIFIYTLVILSMLMFIPGSYPTYFAYKVCIFIYSSHTWYIFMFIPGSYHTYFAYKVCIFIYSLVTLGMIMFIPGSYPTYFAYKVCIFIYSSHTLYAYVHTWFLPYILCLQGMSIHIL